MAPDLSILTDHIFDGFRFRKETLRIEVRGEVISNIEVVQSNDHVHHVYLDVRGKTLLPGLINAHTHIVRGGMFGPDEPLSVPQIIRNLRSTLTTGVTTIGDMGCAAGLIRALDHHTKIYPSSGPSILASGPLLTAPKGYPLDWMPRRFEKLGVAVSCSTEHDAHRAVQRVAESGMHHVKLAIMHRSYGDRPLAALGEPVAKAAVTEAHRLGMRVFAHAHSVADYQVALAAGVDALMHSSFEPLDTNMIARIVDSGVYVCPTLWVFESICLGVESRWDHNPAYAPFLSGRIKSEWTQFCEAYAASGNVFPEGIAQGLPKARHRQAIRTAAANLALLRDAGVPIGFGNDAAYGFCIHEKPVDELKAMQRSGMTIVECLRAATSGAASLLGCTDRGALLPGRRADIVIVTTDIERDLSALEQIQALIVAGKPVQNSRIRQTLMSADLMKTIFSGLALTGLWSVRDSLLSKEHN